MASRRPPAADVEGDAPSRAPKTLPRAPGAAREPETRAANGNARGTAASPGSDSRHDVRARAGPARGAPPGRAVRRGVAGAGRPARPRLPLAGERRRGPPHRGAPLGALVSRTALAECRRRAPSPPEPPHPPRVFPTALGLDLVAPAGRHVGFLALLSGSRRPSSSAIRRRLRRLAPVLARGIDPMRPLLGVARLVRGHRRRGAPGGRWLPAPAGPAGGPAPGPRSPSWPWRGNGSTTDSCTPRSSGRWAARTPPTGTSASRSWRHPRTCTG